MKFILILISALAQTACGNSPLDQCKKQVKSDSRVKATAIFTYNMAMRLNGVTEKNIRAYTSAAEAIESWCQVQVNLGKY